MPEKGVVGAHQINIKQTAEMKSILVVGQDPQIFGGVLATAWLVAERFGSYVEGVAIRAPATFEGLEAEEVARAVRLEVARSERLKNTFQEFARGRQISGDPGAGERGSVIANWPVDEPVLALTLGERGRIFDLIVVGRSDDALKVPDTPVMESALFDSGKPVLIAPQDAPKPIGNTVLIAWNGASESARAVTYALPFLHAAGEVLVLEVEGGSVVGPDAQNLRTYLTRHGISSQCKTVAQDGAEPGQVILDEAASFGADLIVKGAYTHSRLRQMIFGGATKHLLAASPIPLLMAH
jgi:nucleotide-binding universal stress UspA family protein